MKSFARDPMRSGNACVCRLWRLALLAGLAAAGRGGQEARAAAEDPPPAEPTVTVTPAAAGAQLVRIALAFPRGMLREGQSLLVDAAGAPVADPALRCLTWHEAGLSGPRSLRGGLVTFPWEFSGTGPVRFRFRPGDARAASVPELPVEHAFDGERMSIRYRDGPTLRARLLAPPRAGQSPPRLEEVESNRHYRWIRWHLDDGEWPRIVELRAEALGGVTLVAHLQRRLPRDECAPGLGWEVELADAAARLRFAEEAPAAAPISRSLRGGAEHELRFGGGAWVIYHPAAAAKRRGRVELEPAAGAGTVIYRYWRCTEDEAVPMQESAWQRAETVIAPAGLPRLTAALRAPHTVAVGADAPAGAGRPLPPELAQLVLWHHDAIVRSMATGDDWGNVTLYSDASGSGAVYGMNRLNHCPPIFDEARRTGDARLLETALLWCDNFHDQSIWWGAQGFGGTRYNNVIALGQTPPRDDRAYMWRSNDAVSFCTKGYDAFLLAYEQTGDPRMLDALHAQVEYATKNVHADQGECRNVGDVREFVRLYEGTGDERHLEQALRLFRELRGKLSAGDLFSQGGQPIVPSPPFIDDDRTGSEHPFAKPYIIGYALGGLPALARHAPDEPKLGDVIAAVSRFLVASQDRLGGWRYPHPGSSGLILGQALEHAWQLVQAASWLGPDDATLDAVERVLHQRIWLWREMGKIANGLTPWEVAAGKVGGRAEIAALYAAAGDRDARPDYALGRLELGACPPEGLVYFPEVLAWYLRYRPASRLLAPPRAGSPLALVLARFAAGETAGQPLLPADSFQQAAVGDNLPVFRDDWAQRLEHPLSWLAGRFTDFAAWRERGRSTVMRLLLDPPPAAGFAPAILAEEDRGGYTARKLALNLTGDSRVLAYVLVPKGQGPFPAVLLLHDHGARFDIGKEKVIRPWEVAPERLQSAEEWTARLYGGRFIGDELARRGYVCFATDALNWGDRGGAGYDGQQALAANLLHFGMSFAGLIAHEDLRAAEFLATRREVDPARVAAMGLSMGGFRTWQVAALSDRIAAGAAICWMATVEGLMVPGNNQTRGQSAYTMTHPGLLSVMDYPDVASLACPKPMLFYAGRQDGLFPVGSVEAAFAKLRAVWDAQGAGARLDTRIWDVPHLFDAEMQEAAFAWLDARLAR